MPAALPTIDTTATLCCAPLGSAAWDATTDAQQIAARLRALADANRVRIVQALACCEGHEMTTTDVAHDLRVTDATASHHLKQLEKAGLVRPRRDGARVHYRLDLESTRAIATALNVTCGSGDSCCEATPRQPASADGTV
ncbi:MAG: helix-turn-helix domain-containing protein, partial [Demequina sp.]